MKILVTSSRMPFALDEIRKLGRAGHEIHATDTFGTAPGNHSRYVARRHVTASPTHRTRAYLRDIVQIIDAHDIELVLPTFEEAFYVMGNAELLPDRVRVFAPPFQTLARLHDKARFTALARELGIAVPRTILATTSEALHAALRQFPRYFARPSYSRGGVSLLTNAGPMAAHHSPEECTPTPANPWLVQEFVQGTDICSFSVVRGGKISAHTTYVHPKTLDGAGGIVFESIDDREVVDSVQKFAAALDYEGQLSFDFIRAEHGDLVAIECNPRATAGVYMMPDSMFVDAVLGPVDHPTRIAPAGSRWAVRSALLRQMVVDRGGFVDNLREMLSSARDVYFTPDDVLPALFQFLSLSQVVKYRRLYHARRTGSDLLAGYFYDVSWDGGAIAGAPQSP